uniref:Tick transposon n=1 Tax=Haemonchus placei TaxID=6290 RepID=A0A0N4WS52_HAEPC
LHANVDTVYESEIEKSRSVVIIGLSELNSSSAIERANYDFQNVNSSLNHLDVECVPTAVYRMGKVNSSSTRPRLIKIVFPASRYQKMAVRRAPRLRSFDPKGVFLRPSLSLEERLQYREARLAKKSCL